MPNPCHESNQSQMHLDAMLYLLEDPSLDRSAFEARLENDTRLSEILSNTVDSFQLMRDASCWESPLITTRRVSEGQAAKRMHAATVSQNWSWRLLGTLAASLLVAVVCSWQVIQIIRQEPTEIAIINPDSENNIVLAWSDIQSDVLESLSAREIADSEIENENTLAMLEPTSDMDVPDWIVLATSDALDGGFESRDGKVMMQ